MSEEVFAAIAVSLKVALCSTAIMLLPAVLCGYYFARTKTFWARALEIIVLLPLVLPPVVLGYGLLMLLSPSQVLFRFPAAVAAAVVVSFPIAVRACQLSFEAIPIELEQVAQNLGAGRLKIFSRILAPLALPGIATGALFAFMRSIGELGATLLVAGNIGGETRTLSVAIWSSLQRPGGEAQALMLAGFSLVLGISALLVMELFLKKMRPLG